ncbi:Na+/H+ antiporter [Gluconacetobacter aggeris]|uniref:Na+/H+ antiporter n=1 Tax=Gluconacetobacter aggeris TaxID=1286186 RepID=A0A7W4IPU4_9PROT|nr:Na+/H+ antiporter [Gluconacetobacter aggeris]MBB2166851.1 Na+/H+ antiporter [Gluconacetobacter aggeris]
MSDVARYEYFLFLLLVILALERLARRLALPPAAAFILGGTGLALLPGTPELTLDPDLVMVVFLPPLLMSSAWFTAWHEFRRNLRGILALAVGTTLFTTLAVGVAARLAVPSLPWAVCFTLGAIVSPPDAVAAEAAMERLSLPGRITSLLLGESLLNDATGLVLFRFALAAALTGLFDPMAAVGAFCLVSVGGVAIGAVLGWGGLFLIRRLRDSDLIITATVLLAAASYIGADRLHVSGVLATVTTGLMLGWNQHADFSAGTRVRAQAFWKVMVFLLQSVLFILIGLSLRGVLHRLEGTADLLHRLVIPMAAILATMIVSRFVWLFGADGVRAVLRRWWPRQFATPSLPETIVMGWSGMRGVVTLAAALSLPEALPGRDLALCCAFAAILVTVLLQGITLEPLVRALKLTDDEAARIQSDENTAWVRVAEAQLRAIERASRRPDGTERHPRLLEQYRHRLRVTRDYAQDMATHRPEEIAHYQAVLAAIQAARAEILALHHHGQIHDHVLREMEQDLDMQEIAAGTRL